ACKIGEGVWDKWKGRYVLHLIIFKGNKYYCLSGDNNLYQVERMNYKSVIASVITCHREGTPIEVMGMSFRWKGIFRFLLRPMRWINLKIEKSKKKIS